MPLPEIREVTRFQLEQEVILTQVGILAIPLYRGMKAALDPPGGHFEVVGWSYFREPEETGLLIKVRRLPEPAPVTARQEEFNLVAAAAVVLVGAAVTVLSVMEPTLVKGVLGRVLQPVVGFGTWLLLIAAGIYAEIRLRARPAVGSFVRWAFIYAGVIVGCTLAVEIAPAGRLHHFPEDYARYFDTSVRTYQAGWKLVAAVLSVPLGAWAWFAKGRSNLEAGLEGLGAEKRP